MGSHQKVIEINGKKFDSKTGKLLTGIANQQGKLSKSTPNNVDGFIKQSARKTSAKAVHVSAQRAKTLMRSVVKKPQIGALSASSDTSQSEVLIHHDGLDAKRLRRAQAIAKSRLVSRFGKVSFSDFSIKPKHANLPVKSEPVEAKASIKTKAESPNPNPVHASLEKATAHQAKKLKKPGLHRRVARKLRISSKRLNVGLGVIAAVMLIGFFANQNMHNLEVRVASTRAGVSANLPGYLPSGFSMHGRVAYRPGEITINYKSNSDQRSFAVKQTTSAWDSQSLLENFVAVNQRAYQTYQDNGKTIFIYEGSNATWVDQGIWYQIEGNSSLNSDQLLRLANSI